VTPARDEAHSGRPQPLLFAGWSTWSVLLALTVSAVVMVLGAAEKGPCTEHERWRSTFADHECYTDISVLYAERGLNLPFGWFGGEDPRVQHIEYPPVIVLAMEASARLTHRLDGDTPRVLAARARTAGDWIPRRPARAPHSSTFYWVNAAGLAVAGTLALWLLAGMVEQGTALRFLPIVAPIMLFDGFVNWDLLSFLCVTLALVAWRARRPGLTGVAVGVGTATKLYPALLLGAVVVLAVRTRRLGTAVSAVGAALAAWVVVDLPFYLLHPDSWRTFWEFSASRAAGYGSLWYAARMAGIGPPTHVVTVVSLVLFALVCVGVLWVGLRVAAEPSFAALSLLLVVGFVVTSKVSSPQYVLWMLPLVVVTSRRWRLLAVWCAAEVAFYLITLPYLTFDDTTWLHWVYGVALVARAAAEIALAGSVVQDLLRAPPAPLASSAWQPPRTSPGPVPTSS
jgi:hypothetical protein